MVCLFTIKTFQTLCFGFDVHYSIDLLLFSLTLTLHSVYPAVPVLTERWRGSEWKPWRASVSTTRPSRAQVYQSATLNVLHALNLSSALAYSIHPRPAACFPQFFFLQNSMCVRKREMERWVSSVCEARRIGRDAKLALVMTEMSCSLFICLWWFCWLEWFFFSFHKSMVVGNIKNKINS